MISLKGSLIMELILFNLLSYTVSGHCNPIESPRYSFRLFLIAILTYHVLTRLSRSRAILSLLLSDLIIIVSDSEAPLAFRTAKKKVINTAVNFILNNYFKKVFSRSHLSLPRQTLQVMVIASGRLQYRD